MIAWLLAAVALSADISVPAGLDPLGWARAWSHIVDAQQDPSLDDTRIVWAQVHGRWVLTLEHGRRRATVDGLEPAEDWDGRLEQLYVALALVGRMPPRDARADLRARVAPPLLPTPPPPQTPPRPPGTTLPVVTNEPEEAATPPLPVLDVPRTPVTNSLAAPTRPRPRDEVVRISVVDTAPEMGAGAPVLLLGSLDSQAGFAIHGQGRWRHGRFAAGGRAGLRYDPDVTVRGLASASPVRGRALEFAGLAETKVTRWGLWAGLGAGAHLRRLALGSQSLGQGLVPIVETHVAYIIDGALGVRVEVGVTSDLRPMGVAVGIAPPVFLPAQRVAFTFGVGPRGGA